MHLTLYVVLIQMLSMHVWGGWLFPHVPWPGGKFFHCEEQREHLTSPLERHNRKWKACVSGA